MTNHWSDMINADVAFIMGGNPAENHPISMNWLRRTKEAGAILIHVEARGLGRGERGVDHDDDVEAACPPAERLRLPRHEHARGVAHDGVWQGKLDLQMERSRREGPRRRLGESGCGDHLGRTLAGRRIPER